MIRITSKREGFRRAGLVHSTIPQEYEDGALADEQMALLKDEPMLTVTIVDQDRKIDRLVLAIGRLPMDNPDLWTASGAPQVSALEDDLEEKITAEERDQAWKIYQEARD